MRNRTSPIWKLSSVEFEKRCKSSNSLAAIIRSFNLQADAGNYKTLKKRIKEEGIDTSHIVLGVASNKGRRFQGKYTAETIVEAINSGKITDNTSVRNYIIKWNLIPHDKCAECGLSATWNKKPLTLQMDHKNGNQSDHKLINLQFICPNCHSQTPTFAGRKTKRKKVYSNQGVV